MAKVRFALDDRSRRFARESLKSREAHQAGNRARASLFTVSK